MPVLGPRPAGDWVPVSHGLHRLRDQGSDLPAWSRVLPPGGRFTHLTAAVARGWWIPPMAAELPVFAAIGAEEFRPRRDGLHVRRTDALLPAARIDGLPVDSPADLLLNCARDLGLLDLVVLADAALATDDCTLDDLRAAAGRRRRGAPMLRRALRLADARSESAYESLLRVLHVVCEVDVQPQFEIRGRDGDLIARADLWLVGTTTIHEYDGGDHLSVAQQRKDLARSRRLGDEIWVRRGYTAHELLRTPVTILRDADLTLGRPHRADRIRPWHALLAESLFTSAGRARLLRCLGVDAEVRDSHPG